MAVAKSQESSGQSLESRSIEELFLALETPLLVYARHFVNDSEIAEDLVQDAFVRLHGAEKTVREPRPWLFRTVRNLALNHLRKNRKIIPLETANPRGEPLELPDPERLPDEKIEWLEAIGQTRVCLGDLDARSRELIRLKFEEDLSYKEIGVRTGLTVSHVGYLLHHALKALSSALARTGIVP